MALVVFIQEVDIKDATVYAIVNYRLSHKGTFIQQFEAIVITSSNTLNRSLTMALHSMQLLTID